MKLVNVIFLCVVPVSLYSSNTGIEYAVSFLSLDQNDFEKYTYQQKEQWANSCILSGFLNSYIADDQSSNTMSVTVNQKEALQQLVITRCLLYGNTLKKLHSQFVNIINDENRHSKVNSYHYLDMTKLNLVTVRDWSMWHKFNTVECIDLSDNPLHELPAQFFRLFPRLKRIKLKNTHIKHLFTEFMPYGLYIEAQQSKLESITTNNLGTHNLTIDVTDTPITKNVTELKKLYAACAPVQKNCLLRWINYCRCTYKDPEEDVSSIII
jgi:hypothetical protein